MAHTLPNHAHFRRKGRSLPSTCPEGLPFLQGAITRQELHGTVYKRSVARHCLPSTTAFRTLTHGRKNFATARSADMTSSPAKAAANSAPKAPPRARRLPSFIARLLLPGQRVGAAARISHVKPDETLHCRAASCVCNPASMQHPFTPRSGTRRNAQIGVLAQKPGQRLQAIFTAGPGPTDNLWLDTDGSFTLP